MSEIEKRTVKIFDTTLRDGEQTPGVSFPLEYKIQIARQLDKLGVDIIEAGFPIASKGELEAVKTISKLGLSAQICGLARVVKEDVDACIDCDVDLVHVFVSTSDIQREHTIKKSRKEIIDISVSMIEYVKDHGLQSMFSAMDATRTDINYLKEIFKAVEDSKVDIINVPDTVGIATPTSMHELISELRKTLSVPIDVHCHNDFGLAVANSIVSVEAGANEVQVTINGLGERAGNANLAEVVMILHSLEGIKTSIRTEYLVETSRLIERLSGIKMPPNTPITGENAFSHESGIHTHGVIIKSDTFEPGVMTPEMVGHRRRLVIGKHAGKHAIEKLLRDYGYVVTPEHLNEIVERIKELGDKGKKVTDLDLFTIAEVVIGDVESSKKAIQINEVTVITGNKITPTAVVNAVVHGKKMVESATGVGPVDSALRAVQKLVGDTIRLTDFKIEAITGGSDALAEVFIGVEDSDGNTFTARAARDDIVMASVEALVNAINRMIVLKKMRK